LRVRAGKGAGARRDGGVQVFCQIRHLRSDPRIVISSGVNRSGLAISICADFYGCFLAKPWASRGLTYVGGVRVPLPLPLPLRIRSDRETVV